MALFRVISHPASRHLGKFWMAVSPQSKKVKQVIYISVLCNS